VKFLQNKAASVKSVDAPSSKRVFKLKELCRRWHALELHPTMVGNVRLSRAEKHLVVVDNRILMFDVVTTKALELSVPSD
jgi:hypothetical protein